MKRELADKGEPVTVQPCLEVELRRGADKKGREPGEPEPDKHQASVRSTAAYRSTLTTPEAATPIMTGPL